MKTFGKIVTVIFILVVSLSFTGCSSVANMVLPGESGNSGSKDIKNSDNTLQISTPSSWAAETQLNSLATLQVSNRLEEKYVIVIREGKDAFASDMNIGNYTDIIANQMSSAVANSQISQIQDMTYNNRPAQYFELSGEVQKIKVSYMLIAWEDNNNFYQTVGWTLTPKFDANKSAIMDVMESVKTINN